MPRRDADRLEDIVEAIDAIGRYRAALDNGSPVPEAILDGIVYRLIQIGEAAQAMTDQLKEQTPHVPWARMAGCGTSLLTSTSVSTNRSWTMSSACA